MPNQMAIWMYPRTPWRTDQTGGAVPTDISMLLINRLASLILPNLGSYLLCKLLYLEGALTRNDSKKTITGMHKNEMISCGIKLRRDVNKGDIRERMEWISKSNRKGKIVVHLKALLRKWLDIPLFWVSCSSLLPLQHGEPAVRCKTQPMH